MELPLLRRKKRISLEMIDFQNDDFGADMELVLTELQKKVFDNTYKDSTDMEEGHEVRDLSNMIFDRFGLKVKITTDGPIAAVLPFYLNKNHIFISEMFRGNFTLKDQEKIIRKANGRSGTVNSHTAKVGGIFSEYENQLYLNFNFLFRSLKLSVGEVVAVTLHELGHAFYACEYSNRLETNNQILQAVAQEISSKKSKADRVYIYKELQIVNSKVTAEEIDQLVDGNSVVAGVRWFNIVIGSVKEQLSNNVYGQTSFEALADNFATRFKYTRQLVTALDKLHRNMGSVEVSKPALVFTDIMTTLAFVVTAAGAAALFTTALPAAMWCALVSFMVLRFSGEDFTDYTYDTLKVRYKRARAQYIELLKDLKISPEKIQDIVADIETLDRVISNTPTHERILSFFANIIFTSAGDARKSVLEQQLLEELSTNDLFLVSAKLRTLQ